MPSSTFSSDRAPRKRYSIIWICAGVLSVSVIAGVESFWRAQGHVPVVNDGQELWSWYRNEVYGNEGKTVVLVGRSRQMCGFWTEGFRERFPDHKLVQLSVAGAKVLPVFRNLAMDDEFQGTVLCSIMPYDLSAPEDQPHPYLDYYIAEGKQYESLIEHWEFGAKHYLNSLVAFNPRTSLKSAWRHLYTDRSLPEPVIDQWRFDRAKYYDFSDIDLEKKRKQLLKHNRPGRAREPKSWLRGAVRIEPYVEKIQSRGGRVVFLRYPTTGENQKRTETKYPKEQIWDRFAEATSAETLHFQDVPAMCEIECPDLSHLDIRDAPRFTSILLDELVRRDVLPRGANVSDTVEQLAEESNGYGGQLAATR